MKNDMNSIDKRIEMITQTYFESNEKLKQNFN